MKVAQVSIFNSYISSDRLFTLISKVFFFIIKMGVFRFVNLCLFLQPSLRRLLTHGVVHIHGCVFHTLATT